MKNEHNLYYINIRNRCLNKDDCKSKEIALMSSELVWLIAELASEILDRLIWGVASEGKNPDVFCAPVEFIRVPRQWSLALRFLVL